MIFKRTPLPIVSMRRYRRIWGGRIPLESLAGMKWNRWPESRGISGRFAVESVAGIVWNTQYQLDAISINLQQSNTR